MNEGTLIYFAWNSEEFVNMYAQNTDGMWTLVCRQKLSYFGVCDIDSRIINLGPFILLDCIDSDYDGKRYEVLYKDKIFLIDSKGISGYNKLRGNEFFNKDIINALMNS